MKKKKRKWDENNTETNVDILFKKFQDSIIAISYGEPGNPSIKIIAELLSQYKSRVDIFKKHSIIVLIVIMGKI